MKKVLIADKMSIQADKVFNANGIKFDKKIGLSEEEICEIVNEYEAIVVRSATKITKKIIQAGNKLKVLGRAGIGVDNIDIETATNNGIVVMNTPFGNSITTAEHTISLMMSLARNIPQASKSTKEGKWEKSKFMGTELFGKTLGMIGCGNIGSLVAERCIGLKMKVCVYDPFLSKEQTEKIGAKKFELEEILLHSDFITLHTPLTDQTKGILNKENLSKCKNNVKIINCARGGLIDENELSLALNQERIGGAAIDVFIQEPIKNITLLKSKNLIVTPHLGASTIEAQKKVSIQVANQVCDYLLKGSIVNAVNTANISPEETRLILPYINLAKLLGKFLGQVKSNNSNILSLKIELDGNASKLIDTPIISSVLVGFLGCYLDSVNFINASLLAKEKGLSVSSVKHNRSCDYQSLIRVTAVYNNKERTIAGTLIGGNKPRITEVQNISVEANFSQYMIYIRNYDLPGFIGSIGTALGENKINIASFHLGRRDNLGEAIALIAIDQPISGKIMKKIISLENVVRADYLNFSKEIIMT